MYRIFIVEDDAVIAKILKEHLEKWDYQVDIACDLKNVTDEFEKINPHVVLMDISLPFYNGYHWCTQIRSKSNVPVIFISSMNENMNIVMAINMGGDDFISKPFDLNVVTAKIQAIIRRTYSFSKEQDFIDYNQVRLNLSDCTIMSDDKKIELTKNEYRIMLSLMENAGHIVPRDKLMEKLWESEAFVDDNTLTVNIKRLRKKLEENGIQNFIKTKKGTGYIIE